MQNEGFYLGTVFVAGILSFFSPCIVPLLPVYFGIFMSGPNEDEAKNKRLRLFAKSLLFVAGLSVNFILLGFGVGFLGSFINARWFMVVMGAVVVILGLHQTGLIKIRPLMYERKVTVNREKHGGILGIFLLGFTFSFGWTPCIGPILGAILGLVATGSQPLYGGLLMAVFSLGFLIPFMVLAFFSDILLQKVRFLHRHLDKIKIAGGVIIIIMGLFLMTDNLNLISSIFV